MPIRTADHSECVTVDGRDFVVNFDAARRPIYIYECKDGALKTYANKVRMETFKPGTMPSRIVGAVRVKMAAKSHAAP